ncbi:unnamed protein product [Psylliodes chrysocephalus]|uniref:Tc1-like transposase DDE domain-containing protein n=1 Tax=Psylliodes chrysocephalus TaxID=3402493 RepID=A0A9P0CUU3_9CUCU|nr:unnamed protein product [Psylliodes chrysocephala]
MIKRKVNTQSSTNSVITCDSYHNVQTNRTPNFNSLKNDMIEWLTKYNIPFNPTSLKPEFYEMIKSHKDRHVIYAFNELGREYAHTALRLPPYHPDLNPIEVFWATVKNNVSQRNVTFKLEDEFNKIVMEEWKK